MRCPSCGQENADTSDFCYECGARLKDGASTTAGGATTPAPPSRAAPPSAPDERLPSSPSPPSAPSLPLPAGSAATTAPERPTSDDRTSAPEVVRPGAPRSDEAVLTHLGATFALGYGPDRYAVWDLRKAGEPVASFEATSIGWEAAWRRFHDLERQHAISKWRRPTVGWILTHAYIGLIALGFLQGFLLGFVLAVGGRDIDAVDATAGWMLPLVGLTGLGAWLLFVYLRKPASIRWAVFLGLVGAALALALTVGFATLPADGG